MAASRTCGACLRQLSRRPRHGLQRRSLRSPGGSAQRSYSAQQAPALYLDFLAPAWRTSRNARLQPPSPNVSRPSRSLTVSQRSFSSTPTRHATKAVTNPRKDDDGNEMLVTITPRAAHRLRAIATKDSNPDLALRVSVESGGCHGFQYLMSLIKTQDIDADEDTVFEDDDPSKGEFQARVVMDEPSLELLKGSSVDYTMELIGSQFKVTGIPGAKSSCGCGTSFDIA